MSRAAIFFLLVIGQILAILLALLGFATLSENLLGWVLLLVGSSYVVGVGIVYFIRKRRFWDSDAGGQVTKEEKGDRSFWFISLGMVAAFFFSPLEFIYLPVFLPRNTFFMLAGLGMVLAGVGLVIWARRTLNKNYSGHLTVTSGQGLIRTGPYRNIRHPAYAGYLLMALGISLGYSSLGGLISTLALLVPGLVYRMNFEEKMLTAHFGEPYRDYMQATKRIIPGIW